MGDDVRLRPLTIGEIFDRAVTLYVRNAKPLLLLTAISWLPLTIFRYFWAKTTVSMWRQILSASTKAAGPPDLPDVNAGVVVSALFGILAVPFVYAALASIIGARYRRQTPSWTDAIAQAVRHGGAVILVVLCAFGFYGVAASALFFGLFAIIAVLTPIAAAARSVAPVGALLVVMAFMLAFFFVVAVAYVAAGVSLAAIGAERASFKRAFGSGFARMFSRSECKKASLMALSIAAVVLAVSMVQVGVEGLCELVLRSGVLDAAMVGVIGLVAQGFYGVLFTVYYYDLRVRHDGLDVEAALDAAGVPAAS